MYGVLDLGSSRSVYLCECPPPSPAGPVRHLTKKFSNSPADRSPRHDRSDRIDHPSARSQSIYNVADDRAIESRYASVGAIACMHQRALKWDLDRCFGVQIDGTGTGGGR
jgi:hypothetical protein